MMDFTGPVHTALITFTSAVHVNADALKCFRPHPHNTMFSHARHTLPLYGLFPLYQLPFLSYPMISPSLIQHVQTESDCEIYDCITIPSNVV